MALSTPLPKRLVTFLALLLFTTRLLAQSEEHLTENWITDGSVYRVEHSNGLTMVSGNFTQVGPYAGHGVATDPFTGTLDTAMPKIHGEVYSAISDGTGGWYVGGHFNAVDTVLISNLVHIKADKSVDRNWKPNPDSDITVLTLSGTTLYLAGYFNTIAGKTQSYIASFDITTGALTNWNPNPNNQVYSIDVAGSTVYVGGYFSSIGGVVRTGLAAINAAGIATSWAPVLTAAFTPYVRTTEVDVTAGFIYVGGSFLTAAGVAREGLAKISLTTGATDVTFNAALSAGATVEDIALSGNVVYVCGNFTSSGAAARNSIAALDNSKGSALGWYPVIDNGYSVSRLSIVGNTIYLAGYFLNVNATPRVGVAAVDISKTTAAVLTNWAPVPNQSGAQAIAATANAVFIGGYMNGFNWVSRPGFAVFDDETHQAWPFTFDLNAGGVINTMAFQNNVLYVGGHFSLIGKDSRSNLAAFDFTTGRILPWNPNVYGASPTDITAEVYNIRLKGNLLYVAGKFLTINTLTPAQTVPRPSLAAIDLSTGVPNTWNPAVGDGKTISQYVNSIDIVGSTVYVAGNFSLVGGSNARGNLASVDATSGGIQPWAPVSNGEVTKIRVASGAAYVVGNFANGVGGQIRTTGVAALNLTNGNALPWSPGFNGTVTDVTLSTTDVYVSGYYSAVDNDFRPGLSSFALSTGNLNDWTPDLGGNGDGGYDVSALSISANKLFVAGYFRGMGLEDRNDYGEYAICPDAPVITLSQDGSTLSIPATTGAIQWYRDNTNVSGATSNTLPINMYENGIYAVQVTLNGCVGVSDPYVYLITGREKENSAVLSLYPNPVRDELNVHLKEAVPAVTFTVSDVTGRNLKITQSAGQDHILSVRDLPPGPYVLMIDIGGQKQAHKIIKIN